MAKKKELEIVKHLTMSQLEVFVVELTARNPHGHDDLEIGLVLEGSLFLYIDQERYRLSRGDIYIINRHQIHSFAKNSPTNRILAFQINTELYRTINYSYGSVFFQNNVIHDSALYGQLYKEMLSCTKYYFSGQDFSELMCSSSLLRLFFLLLENSHFSIATEKESANAKNDSLRLNRIVDYIGEHYMEKLSLQSIADQECLSPYHVSHFISRMLGISFQDYLNQVRFEHALFLINQSSLAILDICMECGFSNSRYLNQMFQKHFSCSVKEYKKLVNKPPYNRVALPTENIQKRYSYEQSRLYLEINKFL